MKTPRRWPAAVAALIAIVPAASRGQDLQAPGRAPATREAIEADFRRDVARAERTRIERLAALAAGQPKDAAARTYAELFRLAIDSGHYAEAEPTADRLVRSGGATADMGLLAEVVSVLAKADRGAYRESLDSLADAIKVRDDADAAKGRRTLPLAARLALANIYVEHLIHAAQYDVARQALAMIRDSAGEPALKSLAGRRLAQLDLVGKPAPAIVGTSIDGQPVRVADSKGDVVLVVFWATWCAPNAEEAERLGVLDAAFRARACASSGSTSTRCRTAESRPSRSCPTFAGSWSTTTSAGRTCSMAPATAITRRRTA